VLEKDKFKWPRHAAYSGEAEGRFRRQTGG